jgi:16S rRNA (guanine527-N7)-methyltransferase
VADPTSRLAPDHAPLLAGLGLEGAAAAALARYLDLVAAWSARVNLTGARTPAARVAVLVAPVVPVAASLAAGPLLDVGSGNGSPGLVLAALRPDLPVTLLEPRQKRWAFLREAARAMGRPEIEVVRARHDEYLGEPARTVTVRALALPLVALAPLLRPGGTLLVWGPGPGPSAGFAPEAAPAPGVRAWRRGGSPQVSRST